MDNYKFKGYVPGPDRRMVERDITSEGCTLAGALGNAWKDNMDCVEIIPVEETAKMSANANPSAWDREDPYAAINELAAKLGCERHFTELADASAWIEDRFNLWIWLQPYFTTDYGMFWQCMATSEKCPRALTLALMPTRPGALADGLVYLLRKLQRYNSPADIAESTHEIF